MDSALWLLWFDWENNLGVAARLGENSKYNAEDNLVRSSWDEISQKLKITIRQNLHLCMGYLGVLLALMILWRAFEKADGQVKEHRIKV